MPVPGSSPRAYHFGGFSLDVVRRTLCKDGAVVHLTSKPFDVLAFLVENSGRVVTKQELMEAVWRDTFVVEDNLTQAILKIRRTLGDETDHPQFVLTIPRVGYRFAGPVDAPDSPAPPAVPPGVEARAGREWGGAAAGRGWRAWAIVSGVVLLATVVLIYWLAGRSPGSRTAGLSTALPEPMQVPLSTASATKPVFEADGLHFLYVGYQKERPGIGDIFRASLDSPDAVRVTRDMDPRGDHPVLTPDGLGVVFTRWRSGDDGTRWPDLWQAPLHGGPPRVLVEQASGAGFSPDGTRIAYSKHLPGSKPLWVAPRADPGRYREISPIGFTPRWSPDGRWIAYTTSDPEGAAGDLWIASDDMTTRRRLTTDRLQFHGLAWMRDSRHVVYGAHGDGAFRVWRVAIDGGPSVAMTAGVGSSSSPTIAPDGRTLLFSHVQPSRNLVYAPDVEGSASTEITEGAYHVWPVLSPDGSRVASVIQTPGFDHRLFITDVGTGVASRASDQPARHPVWLDRGRVGYLGPESADSTDVRVVDLATGANRTWCRLGGPASWLAVSPDGQRVGAVLAAPNGRQSIVVRDLRHGRDVVLTDGGEYEHLRWVPGREALSWSGPAKSAGPQTDGIWMGQLGGSGAVRLVSDGYSPAWNDDGSAVYYSRIGEHAGLWRHDVGRRPPVRLRRWAEIDYFDVRGGRLVFARIGSATRIFRLPLS